MSPWQHICVYVYVESFASGHHFRAGHGGDDRGGGRHRDDDGGDRHGGRGGDHHVDDCRRPRSSSLRWRNHKSYT
ncbi:hypothetical protein YE149_11619 [Yersinia enterocolitica subsp. palearctica YE-149]|uniref:Uncharacterized protein n=1 Tax=Yersinia enterocolitica W22703 TaxID=913028 RepID=F4N5T3_YEREN|nr:hypothetical protein YE149_11619 [Yersinia enterocolitica subsp. palearctica YE-149]CBX73441.1 unknown protein [Yersinia enterocolitica W22703]